MKTRERKALPIGAVLLVGTAVVAVAVAAAVAATAPDDLADRRSEIAARGAEVMPFDLDATTHGFSAENDGGVQTVVADDPRNAAEIGAIRLHLREEAAAFTAGDLSDPASIHGDDMPGLTTLEAGADRLAIRYLDRSDGAEIRFTTTDPTLVAALHDWFDAQVSDHGDHAEHQ